MSAQRYTVRDDRLAPITIGIRYVVFCLFFNFSRPGSTHFLCPLTLNPIVENACNMHYNKHAGGGIILVNAGNEAASAVVGAWPVWSASEKLLESYRKMCVSVCNAGMTCTRVCKQGIEF